MDTARKAMIDARQLINRLTLVCRQTVTFLDGKSALDERRIRRALQDAINQANRYMAEDR